MAYGNIKSKVGSYAERDETIKLLCTHLLCHPSWAGVFTTVFSAIEVSNYSTHFLGTFFSVLVFCHFLCGVLGIGVWGFGVLLLIFHPLWIP